MGEGGLDGKGRENGVNNGTKRGEWGRMVLVRVKKEGERIEWL